MFYGCFSSQLKDEDCFSTSLRHVKLLPFKWVHKWFFFAVTTRTPVRTIHKAAISFKKLKFLEEEDIFLPSFGSKTNVGLKFYTLCALLPPKASIWLQPIIGLDYWISLPIGSLRVQNFEHRTPFTSLFRKILTSDNRKHILFLKLSLRGRKSFKLFAKFFQPICKHKKFCFQKPF